MDDLSVFVKLNYYAHSLARMQAATCSPPKSSRGGILSFHSGIILGHRVWNRHPDGIWMGLGISPSKRIIFLPF